MNPDKVERSRVRQLTDLPNVGKIIAADLERLGITRPGQLAGMDPFSMHARLCEITGIRQDPCMLDVFMSVTCFMNGGEPRPWWAFTAERKRLLGNRRKQRRNEE